MLKILGDSLQVKNMAQYFNECYKMISACIGTHPHQNISKIIPQINPPAESTHGGNSLKWSFDSLKVNILL